ncbi:hypothetical protein TIFTF001_001056 [Ficus carica]|uniref:Uncharacterized protein n=1 Tax=Ficus carica TaxID=3494 RepID=A0AA87YZW8_FICCA|nr:hypothetical protein TIFTF001_001056 [Ficus carica]
MEWARRRGGGAGELERRWGRSGYSILFYALSNEVRLVVKYGRSWTGVQRNISSSANGAWGLGISACQLHCGRGYIVE